MFAEEFAVGIELVTPFLAVFADDGFIVRALFFPANYRCSFGLFLGSLLHCLRHIRIADALFFLFVSVSVSDRSEGESGADRCDCEQLRCIHGYLILTDRSQSMFEFQECFTRRKLVAPIARHRLTRSRLLRSRETQTEENKQRAGCPI